VKSKLRFSKASGSDRAKIEQIITRSGRYAPSKVARRQARLRKGHRE
jgi:hypothetical protein